MVVASDVFDDSGEFDIPSVDTPGVLFALYMFLSSASLCIYRKCYSMHVIRV